MTILLNRRILARARAFEEQARRRIGLYHIFRPDGQWLGVIHTPEGSPVELGRDYVLSVRRDKLNVEYAELHRIVTESADTDRRGSPD